MTDREYLAAELVLGLLEGEQLLRARGLLASDPDFARDVADWEERLAPLFDQISEEAAPSEVWDRVRASIAGGEQADVVALRRGIGRWKGIAAAASAVAASLALVIAYDSTRLPPTIEQPVRGDIMAASLLGEDKAMAMSAIWDPTDSELTVTPGNLPPLRGRSRELWIIPADGTPRSLGLVAGDRPRRFRVADDMKSHFAAQATLAISVEPAGGSPGPGPTGPVIASGSLTKA